MAVKKSNKNERTNKNNKKTFKSLKSLYVFYYNYEKDKVKFSTLKIYMDKQKFLKNLNNVKLKDFNILIPKEMKANNI